MKWTSNKNDDDDDGDDNETYTSPNRLLKYLHFHCL